MNNFLSRISFLLVALLLIFTPACNTSRAVKGGAIGTAAGGAVGGVIGNKAGNTAVGAIIGAAIGGTAGALIGRHMDKQAEELEQELEGAEIARVGEGILVTFDSGLLFDVDSYTVKGETEQNLIELAQSLKEYEGSEVLIEGHTDSTGSDEYNQKLSERRANSVSAFLTKQGVDPSRINTMGYGENQPVADNDSTDGRQQNRRVEVAIYASEEMKEAAKDGNLN